MKCSVAICEHQARAKGLCRGHYLRVVKTGELRPDDPIRTFRDPVESFWRKVNKDSPAGCWRWMGSINKGYGQLRFGTATMHRAHRVAYELLVGPIPDGLHLDHLCRNTRCVNPSHLEPVTQFENNRRARAFKENF